MTYYLYKNDRDLLTGIEVRGFFFERGFK